MKLRSRLPVDRTKRGTISVEDDAGNVVLGPFVCYGKADNAEAASKGNPYRSSVRSFGDHPYGAFEVSLVQRDKPTAHTYGPFFLLLNPTGGDALVAKRNGRTGLAIHGGDPNESGDLRPTFGCLRLRNDDVAAIAAMSPTGWAYVCEEG